MCGIAGFNWLDKELIKKMTEVISHRGPDDSGFYSSKNASLGHRRLSIIDLSKKGHQPMMNKDKSLVIVFNGEIWNYKDLRKELQSKYSFTSNSDTEAIIHGYSEYGEKIFSMLDGMFALCIYDIKANKLLMARDRIGKKPLYYYFKDNHFIFSSEIKSILCHDISLEINPECLSDYLTLRHSPKNITMFKNIYKLPQGSYSILENGKLTIKNYSLLPQFNNRNKPSVDIADNLISSSIKKRLMSDVPIGVFLSGGLDSSAIVAYMSKFTRNIRTFSIGFDSKVDETKYARIIAKKFNTKHTEIKLDQDILKYLPEVVYHFDEPLADPASLPTYLLCKEVSKHVKVALSGEGGDEVFGGYQSFNYIPEIIQIQRIPYIIRKNIIAPIINLISKYYSYPKKHVFLALAEIMKKKSLQESFKELFYFAFNNSERKLIFRYALNKDTFDKLLSESSSLDVAAQKYYFKEWLPNDLLMKADKMSMAHGLEVRTPFLDKELIEYFSGLEYKNKRKRKLFKEVVSKYLPDEILKKKKQGFTLPLFDWFGNKETFDRILPFIERLKNRGIFNKNYIEDLLKEKTKFKNEHKIWVLLNFELWYEIYIEKLNYTKIKI